MSKLIVGVNDLATTNPELAKEWNYAKNEGLKPTEISAGSGLKLPAASNGDSTNTKFHFTEA